MRFTGDFFVTVVARVRARPVKFSFAERPGDVDIGKLIQEVRNGGTSDLIVTLHYPDVSKDETPKFGKFPLREP